MKKDEKNKKWKMQLLQSEEMLVIRAGGKKPDDPKTPDEGIMLL